MGGPSVILSKMCAELKNVPMKVLCVMLVILQSFFMDIIIINCYGDGLTTDSACQLCQKCYWWILGDVIIVACFIASFVMAYKHLTHLSKFKHLNKYHIRGSLPLSCLTWFLYSCYVSAKLAVIFKSGIADRLDESHFIGPQFLKTGICLCGVVFILFVASHHRAKENSKDRMYINSMASGVTFDVLDTVDFLSILFVNETSLILPYALENAVLVIALVNLIRPTFSFLVLMVNHLGAPKIARELSAANILVYIFLINTPYMAIRMFLWHSLKQDVSVFLIKNFVMIFLGIYELYEIGLEKAQEKSRSSEIIEMRPRLTPAHRPSDLIDGSEDEEVPPTYNDSLVDESVNTASA